MAPWTRLSRWALALALVGAAGGCHLLFPYDQRSAPRADASQPPRDGVGPRDAPPLSQEAAVDSSLDLGGFCSCSAADLNGDRIVDASDLAYLSGCYGKAATGTCLVADLNHDGVVNLYDLSCLSRMTGCSLLDGSNSAH